MHAEKDGDVEGTHMHVSVFICLMKGDNADNLKWPFKGAIKVTILNQLEDGQHHTLKPELEDDMPENLRWYVNGAQRVYKGCGFHKFLTCPDLSFQGDDNQQFLKDDTAYFRVDCFEPKMD